MSVLINEAHLGLTTTPIGHSTMLKLKRDWADVSHVWTLTQTSLKPRGYAVLLSLLVCVWVWSVITTNIFHVQAKSSWIYKTLIDEIYRKLCKVYTSNGLSVWVGL